MSTQATSRRRVVLFTLHVFESKRRAGFHWIADALIEMGWDVVFVTVAISWFSVFRGDYRVKISNHIPKNQLVSVKPQLRQFLWWTPWHPANLRFDFLNKMSTPVFKTYGKTLPRQLQTVIQEAEVIIFESTPGVAAFQAVKKINPDASIVYRVSDDLRLLKNHPVVFDFEEELATSSDLISVPSAYLFDLFSRFPKTKLQFHGVNNRILDQEYQNPFENGSKNAVFTGIAHLDESFIEIASTDFPEIFFHIIGPISPKIVRKNVFYYGEMAFVDIIPYVKFADLGLHSLSFAPGAESFSDSLKVLHYSYFKIPIIFPSFIPSNRLNVFKYEPSSRVSINGAVESALRFSEPEKIGKPNSWQYLAALLVGD
jgi:2-beta-glucuronyltransferase